MNPKAPRSPVPVVGPVGISTGNGAVPPLPVTRIFCVAPSLTDAGLLDGGITVPLGVVVLMPSILGLPPPPGPESVVAVGAMISLETTLIWTLSTVPPELSDRSSRNAPPPAPVSILIKDSLPLLISA